MSSTCVLAILAALVVQYNPASAQLRKGMQCVNPRQEQGTCKNIRNCPSLLGILRDYGNVAGEFLRESVCEYEGSDPIVCCPYTREELDKSTQETVVTDQEKGTYGPLLGPDCGVANTTYTRVVGGVPAKLGAWPWVAVLGYRGRQNPNKPRWLCGGTLISARHVLTAGHCVHRRDDLFLVRLGDLDLESDYDGADPIDVLIEKKNVHPEYNSVTYTNDIAVLRLAHDIQFTATIKPICLPVTPRIQSKNLVGSFPFIVGWGAVYFNGPSSSQLQQLQIPVVSPDECKTAFRAFKGATIDDRVMCAGFAKGGKDACQGDSGGPLMFPIGKTFYSVGVVSYGFRCAEPGFPGVYTKTTSFLDFIIPLLN